VRVSARADYAIRGLLELAAAGPDRPVRADAIAKAQAIPSKYLENLLVDLRRARLVASQRGVHGGYRLARAASAITLADVIRAIDGPLAHVRGDRPEALHYAGAAALYDAADMTTLSARRREDAWFSRISAQNG